MAMPSTYKPSSPSPLSFGSPRASPFRRPEPPSPSSSYRPTSPLPSPTKTHTPLQSPSKLQSSSTPISNSGSWTPRGLSPAAAPREQPPSPTLGARTVSKQSNLTARPLPAGGDALAKLPTAQVREMREAFQVLDRDGDGAVGREDVVDVLTNLGQDASPAAVSQFFPPGAPQTLGMPSFMTTLSALLAPLSSQSELVNAFAAFDEDDSGQVDVRELRDALLHTSPEAGERALSDREIDEVINGFKGRREFAKGIGGKSRGEVFRYNDFVTTAMGAGENAKEEKDT